MSKISDEKFQALKREETLTAQNLLSFRDRVFDFTIADPSDQHEDLVLHFKRLKTSEYNDVIAKMNDIGIDQKNPGATTKEQLDGLYAVECLALGYASADGKNAQDWLDLQDNLVVSTCFKYLLEISGPRENISFFRQFSEGPPTSTTLPAPEQVPARTSGDA